MMPVAFVFPGQGSQYVGMGRNFYQESERAREIFALADEVLGFSLSRLCFEGPEEELRLTANTQPALLTVSIIAYELLGIEPDLACGHSLGEYSALVAAGGISFPDALQLVRKRGLYMQEAVPPGKGAMVAVLGLPLEAVQATLAEITKGVVEIANWNSEEQIVVAGKKEAVEEAVEKLKPPKWVALPVSAPFHTSLMKPAEEKLKLDLDQVEFHDLRFPIITNVEARLIWRAEEAREALKRQVSRTVLWSKSMERLKEAGVTTVVEVGAGKVLSGLMRRIARPWGRPVSILNCEDIETLGRAREHLLSVARKPGNIT